MTTKITPLKLQKLLIKKLWYLIKSSPKGQALVTIACGLIIKPGKIATKLFPSSWGVKRFLYCALLGNNRINEAVALLRHIEERNLAPDDEAEIRFMYQSLSSYCAARYELSSLLEIFELRVALHPYASLWAWRILIDAYWYLGDIRMTEDSHSRFLKVREKYAKDNGFDVSNKGYFGSYFTYSIGHICVLADHVMKMRLDGAEKNTLYVNKNKVANYALLSYLFDDFDVIFDDANPKITEAQILNLEDPFVYRYYYDARPALYERWDKATPCPLLTLRDEDIKYGWSILESLGVPKGSWFVTMHIREQAGAWSRRNLRNAQLCDYLPAINEIIKQGGKICRIGHAAMTPLPPIDGVIDFTRSPHSSDRLDVFLMAACRFSIESTSGPANVPIFFGGRSVQTNLLPFRHSVPNQRDLVTPILFFSKPLNRLLTFREMFLASFAHSENLTVHQCDNIGDIEIIQNTSDEILEAVQEMLGICKQGFESHNTLDQERFSKLCVELNVPFRPKISDAFLKRHPELLEYNYPELSSQDGF